MKVNYPLKKSVDVKEIKETLKPFGARCAKIIEGTLEFQIKDENQAQAYEHLTNKGYI